MSHEDATQDSAAFERRYVHSPLRTAALLVTYLIVANGILMLLPLILKLYGIHTVGPVSRHDYWLIASIASVLAALALLARHVSVRSVIVDSRKLFTPHYLFPTVALADVTSVQADQYRRGLVMIGVRNQLPRYIHCPSIQPPISAAGLARTIHEAIEHHNVRQSAHLATASRIGDIQALFPWAAFTFAVLLVVVHAIAWARGSTFDGLDFIASGAFFAIGSSATTQLLSSEVLRLFDAGMLHGGVVHLLVNVAGVLAVGATIERVLGWRIMLLAFAITAPVSILASELVNPGLVHLGASGGICGVIGIAFYLQLARPIALPATMQGLPAWLAVPAAILGLSVLVPGVDWIAHTVGLLLGMCIAAWTFRRARDSEGRIQLPITVPMLAIAPLALLMLAGTVDVLVRLYHLDQAARSTAFIQHITGRTAAADRNALIWHHIVARGHDPQFIPQAILSLQREASPSTDTMDTLASLYFMQGEYGRAVDTQLRALLKTTDAQTSERAEMAAHLVAFAERYRAPATAPRDASAGARSACTETLQLIGNRGSTATLVYTRAPNTSSSASASNGNANSTNSTNSTNNARQLKPSGARPLLVRPAHTCSRANVAWSIAPADWKAMPASLALATP